MSWDMETVSHFDIIISEVLTFIQPDVQTIRLSVT